MAQSLECDLVGTALDELGKAGITVEHRRDGRHAVRGRGEMRVDARPAPVPRVLDEARPHRIESHIAQRGAEMIFVHRHGAAAALPEMAGAALARLAMAGLAPR